MNFCQQWKLSHTVQGLFGLVIRNRNLYHNMPNYISIFSPCFLHIIRESELHLASKEKKENQGCTINAQRWSAEECYGEGWRW